MSFKVAFIGAGSIGFTRGLLADILTVSEFHDIQVSFTDINPDNLRMVTQLCQRDIDENGLAIKIHATLDRREAFRDAKYVINCVRIGMLEAFETDVDIPLKYGVDQCVGDTLCIGGIMYGQRGIAAMLGFCKDIREVAAPGCILLNYSNPNAMVTWACNKYGKVPTYGLCHGVQHGHEQIAKALGRKKEDVDIICAGLNHQTWYVSVKTDGVERTGELYELMKQADFAKDENVRLDVMRNFGYYSTESNGHLSEYLMWYRKRPEEMEKWINYSSWIQGETAGYLRVCRESRNWFETDFPNWLKETARKFTPESRSTEHGSYIIEGLETGRLYRGCFNVMNNGAITNLPAECVVEVPCYVDYNGISIPKVGDLPLGCAAICSASVWVQKLAVEAAVHGDISLLYQAAMMDPLTGAVCTPDEIRQMVDEMLVAGRQWLPQYSEEIPKAEKRLADSRLPLHPAKGFRLHTKTVEEMAEEKAKYRALASAAAKENVK
ncbi:alpha-glucosidase/alpha-galactosidase [uncultured Acetatifactor sp.]|uniref:alpha-glucosidase/alpha-galactosidase n=2 Tax=uncultured Acetatifactor sp. TaxID=1671927 RepID=UPI00263415A8|nr:alpha-glucosidase/alpha-galactosidase [uncultured Acetatifactor sp.]